MMLIVVPPHFLNTFSRLRSIAVFTYVVRYLQYINALVITIPFFSYQATLIALLPLLQAQLKAE